MLCFQVSGLASYVQRSWQVALMYGKFFLAILMAGIGWAQPSAKNDGHARLFEHVRDDLEQVETIAYPPDRDHFRFEQTMRDLNVLQASWRSGDFDKRRLDMVIASLARMLGDNRLTEKERTTLSDDLGRLREFKDNQGWRQ